MVIRLTIPSIEEDDLEAVRNVLQTGYLIQGQHVAAFEKTVADLVGISHAIAVSNGTAALHMALLALNVRAGDLVIVTAYSWTATANVIELCGGQPVFVDIDPRTYNMDPADVERKITPRTRAILINSPHNPSATVWSAEDMQTLQELLSPTDVLLISDEVYEHMVFDGERHASASANAELAARAFSSACS